MIKKLLFTILFAFGICSQSVYAQCANNTTDACVSAAPVGIGNNISCTPPNQNRGTRNFRVNNMIAGATYQISNCGSGFDTQMTIRNLAGVVVAYNDNDGPACAGLAASIDFVPPASGDYRIQLNRATSCATNGSDPNGNIVVTLTADPVAPVANDDPCGALPLSVNATCSFATYTNENASGTTGVPAPTCASYNGGDVWFTAVVPATGSIIVDMDTGVMFDSGMAIYSVTGTCPALTLTQIECDDDDSANGLMSSITSTGLTPGATIYIRVWEFGNNNNGTFDICVTDGPAAPSNDDPCGAISLNVNTICSFSTFTNENATATTGVPAPSCGFYLGGDVWFSTTVPANGSITVDTDTGVILDSGMAIYSVTGTCPTLTLTEIECDDDGSANGAMSSITRTGLTPGETIYIRVWEFGNNNNGTFDICVSEGPSPPTNIDCASAVDITCGQSISGTTNGVAGTVANVSGCTMSDYGVWYHFVGDGNNYTVNLTGLGGYDTELAVLQGGCGTLTNLTCQDVVGGTESYSFITTNLTDYYIYVANWNAGPVTGNFNLSLTCTTPNCTPGPGTGISPLGLPNLVVLDSNGNNPSTASCGTSSSVDLEATYLQLGDPSDYNVANIAYNPPYQFDCLANQFSTFNDDTWSPTVPLGFDFCFYDNVTSNALSQLQANANGAISFESFIAGSNCGYVNDWNVPSAINADGFGGPQFFGRSIYGVHHDLNPTQGGEVGYETITLDTGERAFIISWHDVPMFANNSILFTGMIVLYEHSNVIEIYIEEKNTVFWNDGNATVAIQNNATTGLAAPNRNSLDANWTVTQEAWRFTPSGGGLGSISDLTWYEGSASANGGTTVGLNALGNNDIVTVTPSSDTIYTAEVIYNFCDGTTLSRFEEISVLVSGTKIWDGSEATNDWMEPLNWSDDAIPTASDCVFIPVTGNDPVIYDNDNGDGRNLIIEPGASLTLTSDTDANNFASSLTIQDFIDIQGTGVLTVEDDASLIQVYDSSTAILPSALNSGNITLNRNTEIRNLDYVYWSSPVENFDVSNVYGAFTPTNKIFQWIPTQATPYTGPPPGNVPVIVGTWDPISSGAMTEGKGYIVRGPTNHPTTIATATATFEGVPNNGVITQALSSGNYSGGPFTYNPYGVDALNVTALDDNWNLLGNPYPSALDADTFLTHPNNSIIEGAVHIWTHGTAIGNNGDSFYDDFEITYSPLDYITYNLTGISNPNPIFNGKIGSGQGFFVLALNDNETGSVTFNNSMRDRTHSNTEFYRISNEYAVETNAIDKHRIWLNLIDSNGTASSILVGYIEGATQEKDRLFDAFNREVNSLSLYSKIGDEGMIIQGRALPFDQNDQVPLGTVIPQAGQYSIVISNLDGLFLDENQSIYLEDTYAGVIHNLRTAPYTFTETAAVDYSDRFILRYTNETLGLNELELGSGLTIMAPNSNYIKVNSEHSLIQNVTVYDLLGRVLFDRHSINQSEFILDDHNLSVGTYIVKATLINGQSKAQKIVLKN